MDRSLRERADAFPSQFVLTLAWIVMAPIAVATRWLWSIGFVSAVSIYANAASHWSAHLAWRAKREAQAVGDAP